MTTANLENLPDVNVQGTATHTCIACGEKAKNVMLELPGEPLGQSELQMFVYLHCGNCESLRLADIPEDMSPYYAADTYYSFQGGTKKGLRGTLQRLRDRGAVLGRPWPLRRLSQKWPDIRVSQLLQLTEGQHGFTLTQNTRVLDVGCGSGAWLKRLAAIGFADLSGADPFLENPGFHDGVTLMDKPVEDLSGTYDLIACSHAMEHMPDPLHALTAMRDRLAEGGMVMIRIPLAGSVAWETYGGHWVQLDAPRHLTLFSTEGFTAFSKAAGFDVAHIEYDSGPFMILGSIARQKGILPHKNAPQDASVLAGIREKHGAEAHRIAHQANAEGTADQATFFLKARSG